MKKRIAKKIRRRLETEKALRQYAEMQKMNEKFIEAVKAGETIPRPSFTCLFSSSCH